MIVTSPRIFQDDSGEWWFQRAKDRARCDRGRCCNCGEEYVCQPRGRGKSFHCNRACYIQCKKVGKHPKPDGVQPRGVDAPHWNGGSVNRRGYVLIWAPDHPSIAGKGTQRKYVLEHRLVMEKMIGRYLLPSETVHHINGIRDDNRPENLQLRQGQHGRGAVYQCHDCGSHNVTAVALP